MRRGEIHSYSCMCFILFYLFFILSFFGEFHQTLRVRLGSTYFYLYVYLLIIPKQEEKKNLHSTWVYQARVLCKFFFFFYYLKKGTWAWYTQVMCCLVLEFTKLEYRIIVFLIAQIQLSSATMAKLMRNSSFWNSNSRKSGTLPFISETMFFC